MADVQRLFYFPPAPKLYVFGRFIFFFQAEDGIRAKLVTGVQTCALPISSVPSSRAWAKNGRRHRRAALHHLAILRPRAGAGDAGMGRRTGGPYGLLHDPEEEDRKSVV